MPTARHTIKKTVKKVVVPSTQSKKDTASTVGMSFKKTTTKIPKKK